MILQMGSGDEADYIKWIDNFYVVIHFFYFKISYTFYCCYLKMMGVNYP